MSEFDRVDSSLFIIFWSYRIQSRNPSRITDYAKISRCPRELVQLHRCPHALSRHLLWARHLRAVGKECAARRRSSYEAADRWRRAPATLRTTHQLSDTCLHTRRGGSFYSAYYGFLPDSGVNFFGHSVKKRRGGVGALTGLAVFRPNPISFAHVKIKWCKYLLFRN